MTNQEVVDFIGDKLGYTGKNKLSSFVNLLEKQR